MNPHPEAVPAALFTLHLSPLLDRLPDDQVLTYAHATDVALTDVEEPRIAEFLEQHGMFAILSVGQPCAMLAWPDQSLGPVWFPAGKPVAECVAQAYGRARAALESIHLKHNPAATAWRN